MVNTRLVVSPMAGVTDAPFRMIALTNGADYAISEMITAQVGLWNSTKTQQRLKNLTTHKKRITQIAGASVEVINQAVIACNQLDLDAIEINMGCPAKKVCNVLAGSALMKNPQLVGDILASAVKLSRYPVYLKTRLGFDDSQQNILQIASIAEDAGVKSLAIHGRTRQQMYNGEASYQLIKQVKQTVAIPVFANGDITTVLKAKEVLNYTQADGVYIGRGALGKPWLFNQIKQFINGHQVVEPEREQKKNIILEHFGVIHQHYADFLGVRIARKHLKWYLEKNQELSLSNSQQLTNDFMQLDNADYQLEFIYNL